MPLSFTGRDIDTQQGRNFEAKGSDGEIVVVKVSTEALTDYNSAIVQNVAQAKYAKGEQSDNGSIMVRTTDCAEYLSPKPPATSPSAEDNEQ